MANLAMLKLRYLKRIIGDETMVHFDILIVSQTISSVVCKNKDTDILTILLYSVEQKIF